MKMEMLTLINENCFHILCILWSLNDTFHLVANKQIVGTRDLSLVWYVIHYLHQNANRFYSEV